MFRCCSRRRRVDDGCTVMSSLDTIIQDLVIANRILAKEEVVDAYGHVSIRHPDNPNHFLIARSVAPELVGAEDIVELDLDGQPVRDDGQKLYLERFIHAAIFEARADVMAVVHAHAEDTLPFGIADATPLRPVIHSGSFIGSAVPVWDIADNFGDTNLLVTNIEQGRDLAKCLGGPVVDRGRADVGLSAAQCPRAAAGTAARRPDQIPLARRDRCPQPRLQPLFDRDLACLAILGEQGRLRPPADTARSARAAPRQGARPMSEPIWNKFLTARDKAVFAAGGFGARAGFGKRPALLVIDVNWAFCGERPEPILQSIKRWRTSCGEDAWVALDYIKQLIDKAHEKGLPVIYTTGERRPDNWDAGSWRWKSSRGDEASGTAHPDTDGNEIVTLIAPGPQDIVIRKQKPSGFFGSNLASYLTLLGADSVIVVGTTTSGCVR